VFVDSAGKAAVVGYNRVELGIVKECLKPGQTYFDPDEDHCGSVEPPIYFRPWEEPFDIVLSDDPRWSRQMCRLAPKDTRSLDTSSVLGLMVPGTAPVIADPVPQPDHYPAKDDHNVNCSNVTIGRSPTDPGYAERSYYVYLECDPPMGGPGPCAPRHWDCRYSRPWYHPDPIPADWPCP